MTNLVTRTESLHLAETLVGLSRWDAEKTLTSAGLCAAGAAEVVALHLSVARAVVVADVKELASCVFCEANRVSAVD